jgi:hypothetical protein
MPYTKEQLKYINFFKKKSTKLLACAGSGKSTCIVARMYNLIKNKIYKSDELMMLTFSRFTRDDFMRKIKEYKSKSDEKIPTSQVKTIDSFAKNLIDKDNIIDVSLLSYKLMKYLEETPKTKLKENNELKKIKIIFVDEAQDLNDIQNRIFIQMRKKLGIVINLIGDPNQNIYQFRESSDKYLTEFKAETFLLTKNFRSHDSIVNFSNHLRPFKDNDIECVKGSNDVKPIMMFYEDERILEQNIVDILHEAKLNNIDYSEFAILAPTRGRMRAGGKSHGLCFISNILFKAKIKFKQFYEESVDGSSESAIKYKPKKGHVNVLTYMGSKGLEWNYVILIDADMCLINKRFFSEEKHNHDQYLLYVACSRAIENMYIFSKCFFRSGMPIFSTNPHFEKIPDNLYETDVRFNKLYFPILKYVNYTEREVFITRLIDRLDCYELDKISSLISFDNKKINFSEKIFKNDYSKIEKNNSIFLSKYVEQYFICLYNIHKGYKQESMPLIESIVDTDNIVSNCPDKISEWYYKNRKGMTWNKFNNMEDIDESIKKYINGNFDKKKEFSSHVIAINNYYEFYILKNKKWIRQLYRKYLKCKNMEQIKSILFDLMVVLHGIQSQHYFHIKSKGDRLNHLLDDFSDLFEEMINYVKNIKYNFVMSAEIVSKWGLVGKLSHVDDKGEIWTVKCSSDIPLKNIIKTICLNLFLNPDISENYEFTKKTINCNYINFLTGYEISYQFDLDNVTINNIIDIFIAKASDNIKKN